MSDTQPDQSQPVEQPAVQDDPAQVFDPNLALFVGLAQFVANRDSIDVDTAAERLVQLFQSPEVQAQKAAEDAAAARPYQEAAQARQDLDDAINHLQGIVDMLRNQRAGQLADDQAQQG